MARPSHLFRRGVNEFWSFLESLEIDDWLPPEAQLVERLNLSRGTVRSILQYANELGIIGDMKSGRYLRRQPVQVEYFDLEATVSPSEGIEREFMSRIQSGALRPNERFSELQLARDAGASTAVVREFLIGFSRSGLIEKRPKGGWLLRPFDEGYIRELAQMRSLLELAALGSMIDAEITQQDSEIIDDLIERHVNIANLIDDRFKLFPSLDREFHMWIIRHLGNRFAAGFLTSISAIFHFHYQIPRSREKSLNEIAIAEHLAILEALKCGDFTAGQVAFQKHLNTSLTALLSLIPEKDSSDKKPAVRRPTTTSGSKHSRSGGR